MSYTSAVIFAILAGIFTTIEVTINTKLGTIITPKLATLHSLMTGAIFIFIFNVIKGSISQYKKIIYVSPQWLIGGIFGASIIYFSIKAMPLLGVTKTLTFLLAAQLVSGLVIDTFILGEPLYFYKIAGLILLIISIFFISQ